MLSFDIQVLDKRIVLYFTGKELLVLLHAIHKETLVEERV